MPSIRAYFSPLLHAVPARNALFETQNTLFSLKIFETTSCLGECSILNALNLENFWVQIQNCALLLDFPALFCYTPRIHLIFRIGLAQ